KADVNAKESLRGTTALVWAVEQGHPAAVLELIKHGADVSAATNPDTKGNRAYLAPPVQARIRAAQAAGVPIGDVLAPGGEQPRASAPPRGPRPARPPANTAPAVNPEDLIAAADAAAAESAFGRTSDTDGGGLTPLVFAARENCLECAKHLIEAHADVNQRT